jgi:hypothetical protein
MKLIKAFYIDVEAQKVSELHVQLRLGDFQYFLKGDFLSLFNLGEEAEWMLHLNRQNFKRKKVGFFKLNGISEELYPGNGILLSIDPNFDKSLVYENVKNLGSFKKSVTFYRSNQVPASEIKVKVKQVFK